MAHSKTYEGNDIQDLLDALQQRVSSHKSNVEKIKKALASLEDQAELQIRSVNERCDSVIAIIEEYRECLLSDIVTSMHRQKTKLNHTLKTCSALHQSSLDILSQCHESPPITKMYHKEYDLVKFHSLISAGYRQLDLHEPPDKINAHKLEVDFTKLMMEKAPLTLVPLEMQIGSFIELEPDTKITVNIPKELIIQLVVEHWWRESVVDGQLEYPADPPYDAITVMISYIPSIGSDAFNEDMSHSTFSIDADGQTLSIKGGNAKKRAMIRGSNYCVGFGSVLAMEGRTYRWRLQIGEIHDLLKKDVYIGVLGDDQCLMFRNMKWQNAKHGYSYGTNGDMKYPNGKRKVYGEKGDIVEILLNMKEHHITFGLNGDSYAPINVVEGVKYRLAIGAHSTIKMSIKLLSFSESSE